MKKLPLLDMKGSAVGELDFSDDLLVTGRGGQAVHDVVVAELAALRAGTASTLSKGRVAGSNKKPWQQKGTGRARAGLRQSPVWRGGGVAFGPHPRDYSLRVNRKVGRLAFQRAFSDKVADGQVKVIDELKMTEVKTSAFAAFMKALQISGPALFVQAVPDRNVERASRNIPKVELARASDVNVYQLVRYPVIVLDRAALDIIQKRLAEKKAGKVPAAKETAASR